MKIQYPSSSFPSLPGVSVEIPIGWQSTEISGFLLSAVKEAEPEIFSANLLVSCIRSFSPAVLEQALADVEREMSEMEEVEMLEPIQADFGGLDAQGRAAVFVDETAGTVAQFHVLCVAHHQECHDLVHLTGTIGGNRVKEDFPEMRDILSSVQVTTT